MNAVARITSDVLVELIDGQLTTTSLDVAEHFHKRHDDVLKRLRSLECSPEFTLRNFAECSRPGANNKREPYFRMTRDGFTFLCMGFTGKEAAKWKEAYINAFNQLERAAQQNTLPALQGESFEHYRLRGRSVQVANLDGRRWFSIANLCAALGLGPRKHLLPGLADQHKRKLDRGLHGLWMIDVEGARRLAADCKPEVAADYQRWLEALSEAPASLPAPALAYAEEQEIAIRTLQLLRNNRFILTFDRQGRMSLREMEKTHYLPVTRLAEKLLDPEAVPTRLLPELLQAIGQRLSLRA